MGPCNISTVYILESCILHVAVLTKLQCCDGTVVYGNAGMPEVCTLLLCCCFHCCLAGGAQEYYSAKGVPLECLCDPVQATAE